MATQKEIARLMPLPLPEARLDGARSPAAIRARTGLERKRAGSVESAEVTVESTDGLFTFTVRVVKT